MAGTGPLFPGIHAALNSHMPPHQPELFWQMAKRLFIALELPESCREALKNHAAPIRGVL